MNLTFINDLGQSFTFEVDSSMELENIMALLEAESGVPVLEQSIYHDGRELTDRSATMGQLGVIDDAVIIFRRKVANPAGGRAIEQDAEMMRLTILGDPALMQQLRETQPEVAEAAQNNPSRFAELLRQTQERQNQTEMSRQREIELLNADPFNVEAQRKIEEAIRQQAVMENMEHAIEYSPESFGKVNMLYIPLEVNSKRVKAFVDSGAQQTIMSPECAEQCGIMRLLDRRFSGIARGVGTATILGRVHSAQIKIADLHLPCSFTIMEGRDVDILFGLDMLKAHQACIDLEKNCLRIKGREVKFLSEHELPDKAREEPSTVENSAEDAALSSSKGKEPSFPGTGQTLGGGSSAGSGAGAGGGLLQPTPIPRPPPGSASQHPEDKVRILIDLGATREQAVSLLDDAQGNVDMAASLLFN